MIKVTSIVISLVLLLLCVFALGELSAMRLSHSQSVEESKTVGIALAASGPLIFDVLSNAYYLAAVSLLIVLACKIIEQRRILQFASFVALISAFGCYVYLLRVAKEVIPTESTYRLVTEVWIERVQCLNWLSVIGLGLLLVIDLATVFEGSWLEKESRR